MAANRPPQRSGRPSERIHALDISSWNQFLVGIPHLLPCAQTGSSLFRQILSLYF
jgi:hypothetical protein